MIAILHADRRYGIGKKNGLMFRLPLDMKFFRQTTQGNVVVMGYNTLLSLPGGQPLKNRTNVVLCDKDVSVPGCIMARSVDELLKITDGYAPDDVFVIGGASVYKTLLPYCDKVLLTKVDADGDADVFFPNLDENNDFYLENQSEPIDDNGYTIRFTVYKRWKQY